MKSEADAVSAVETQRQRLIRRLSRGVAYTTPVLVAITGAAALHGLIADFSDRDAGEAAALPEASAPEATPESTPEATPEAIPEARPEAAPEAAPEATPQAVPEAAPEAGSG